MTTLVLNPGLSSDARMWRAQLRDLAEWKPVVSDAATRADGIEAIAATLLADHPGDLVLCGASMGGIVAMEASRQAPGRIRGLALLGTNARPETPEMRTLRESAIVLFEAGRVDEVIRPNALLAFHPAQATDAALTQAYLDFVLDAGADQLVRQNRAIIARPDARLHLPRLRCPTFVACGDADALTPLDCSQEIARLVPGAQLHVIPRCGHMLTMERPDVLDPLLAAWLREVMAG